MTGPARILFAHDDHAFGRTLGWILDEHGYAVTAVPASDELITTLAEEPHDLLVLETASGEEGMRLLARIKGDQRFDSLPVLMLSSLPPEEGSVEALGLGASDFLARPFRVREILARVKAHLRAGRELNRARAEARSRSEMIEILREIASSLSPDEIYQILVRRVARGLKISKCSIILAKAGDEYGTVVAAYENPMLRNLQVELRKYPEIVQALQSAALVLVQDVLTDPLYDSARTEWGQDGTYVPTRSAIALPFFLRNEPTGVFFLRTTAEDPPLNQQDVAFADQVTKAAVAALEKAYDLESAVAGQEEF
jgi:FixJ family two-component response regulator